MAKKRAGGSGGGGGKGRRILGRLIIVAVIGVAAWYAAQGGEYGTSDLITQRKQTAKLKRDVGALQHEVDSLADWKRLIQTDPTVQEKIAREEFGMVRGNKEFLYRIAPKK